MDILQILVKGSITDSQTHGIDFKVSEYNHITSYLGSNTLDSGHPKSCAAEGAITGEAKNLVIGYMSSAVLHLLASLHCI